MYASTILYTARIFGKSTMGRECCTDCGKTVSFSYFIYILIGNCEIKYYINSIKNWLLGFCTKWSLYEMIPRRVYVIIQVPPRTNNPLYEVTPVLLYEMVFVWNIYNSSARVCKNSITSYKKIIVRSDSYAFVRSNLPCTMWSLFEIVFVRSDCQSFVINTPITFTKL